MVGMNIHTSVIEHAPNQHSNLWSCGLWAYTDLPNCIHAYFKFKHLIPDAETGFQNFVIAGNGKVCCGSEHWSVRNITFFDW